MDVKSAGIYHRTTRNIPFCRSLCYSLGRWIWTILMLGLAKIHGKALLARYWTRRDRPFQLDWTCRAHRQAAEVLAFFLQQGIFTNCFWPVVFGFAISAQRFSRRILTILSFSVVDSRIFSSNCISFVHLGSPFRVFSNISVRSLACGYTIARTRDRFAPFCLLLT